MEITSEVAVGVDGCPMGWIAAVTDGENIECETFREFAAVEACYSGAGEVFVDIPIGLPVRERRECDVKARELLGSRGLSVFFPPCQAAVEKADYETANETHRACIGHGLSKQADSIREKIMEVADVVGGPAVGVIRESHPELCFAAMNGQPVAYAKSSVRGRGFRLNLIANELDDAEAVYGEIREKYLLKEVRRDDILDAMALAVAASSDHLTTVPETPDSGDPRIRYPAFEPATVEAP